MPRTFLVGAAALAAVFLALLATIWWATRPPEGPPAAAPLVAGPAPPHPTLPDGQIDLARVPLGGIPLPPPVIVKDEPAPPPPPGSWEAVPILVGRRGPVRLELEDRTQEKLADCFDPAVASRYSGAGIVTVKDAAPLQNETTTTLLLEVEVVRGEALIVEAPLESRGNERDGTIACAQAVLRNQTAPAAGLPSGRHRIRHVLQR